MRQHHAILALLLTACAPAAAQTPVSGFAKSIDGDSLNVVDTEVRLFGIAAPEFDQNCKKDGQDWSCGAAAAAEPPNIRNSVYPKPINILRHAFNW